MLHLRFSVSATVLLAIAIAASVFPVSATARPQDTKKVDATDKASAKLTTEDLNARVENFRSVSDLDESLKTSITQLYETARQQLEESLKAEADLKKYEELASQGKTLIATTKQELADTPETSTLKFSPDLSSAQLEEMLRQKIAELDRAREKAVEATAEPARRQARLLKLPEQISAAEKRLEEIKAQLDAPVPPGENSLLTQARITSLTAGRQSIETQSAVLNAEKQAYTVTAELPPISDSLAQRKVKLIDSDVTKINDRIARLRESEIEMMVRLAEEELEKNVDLRPIAELNLLLAKKLEKTAKRIAEVTVVEKQAETARLALAKRYETTKIRVDAIGLSDTTGIMLRQNKAEIDKLRVKYGIDSKLREEIAQYRADAYLSEDQAQDLENTDAVFLSNAKAFGWSTEKIKSLKPAGAELLKKQQKIWQRLAELQNEANNSLFGLLYQQKEFAKLSSEYSSYIEEHVMWVRSAKVLGASERQRIIRQITNDKPIGSLTEESDVLIKSDLASIVEATQGILAKENWQALLRALRHGAESRLSLLLVIGSGLLLLFCFQPRLKSSIKATAKKASRRSCREMTPTATTFLETILLSFLWPGLVMTLGWLLRADVMAELFPVALGTGLVAVGMTAAPLEFLRNVCRPEGLAQSHFDWPDPARRTIRANVHWLVLFGAPLLLVSVTMHHLRNDDWNNSLGRVSTILLTILALIFVYRVMRPGSPVFKGTEVRDSRFYRLRYLRFGVLSTGFAAMILFAIAGYYYTTYLLGTNVLHTFSVAIALLTLYCLALRFLLVRRRRFRYEQLVTQRENLQKQQRLAAEAYLEGTPAPKAIDTAETDLQIELGTDINSVSRQAKELTGVIFLAAALLLLWQIWQDVLPATKLLDNVELWQVTDGDKGETNWVTLRDLLISGGLFLVTFFSVRNIPGMLELLLLKQLPLDSGSRYAITTIFRYFIVVFGVILALNFLKIPWSNYSWLVAAISVGLGFGLQEIVANFVSGLIILLERPVRVGDVVTIDGTTGFVSRIQMRATTVTNFDNQELVVPNKDLVTGKLLNWTLTNVINRVSLTVGVAYGTDVNKVQRLIMGVAAQNQNVLKDPAPVVSFDEFGDSSLNFKLRCCITSIERRIHIIHELNSGINEIFHKEGIVIPFPQRDLHMISPPQE